MDAHARAQGGVRAETRALQEVTEQEQEQEQGQGQGQGQEQGQVRVLMLGWEFPPHITGGLGTACEGLTQALAAIGHRVRFVLPKPVHQQRNTEATGWVDLLGLSPEAIGRDAGKDGRGCETSHPTGDEGDGPAAKTPAQQRTHTPDAPRCVAHTGAGGVRILSVRTPFGTPVSAYGAGGGHGHGHAGGAALRQWAERIGAEGLGGGQEGGEMRLNAAAADALRAVGAMEPKNRPKVCDGDQDQVRTETPGEGYRGDVCAQAVGYAQMAVAACAKLDFDIIHAHDWMTFQAGAALASVAGKPLVVHVHSTEYDRSGENVDGRIAAIERAGIDAADAVVAVSVLTKAQCERRYGTRPEKIEVVYNGVRWQPKATPGKPLIGSDEKIVLFLGRITMQKGPEYFIAAAKRVLEKIRNVKFLVAGSGDMARRMIEMAAAEGIGGRVLFTGFLRGDDVATAYRMADCYVMPSVSEPFGIAPLEAISHDTPVIISKQSGVAEVLTHALKVDFWDIDEMANKIVAVLTRPPLGATLRAHGAMEARQLTWDGAARRCERLYRRVLDGALGGGGND